MRPVVKAKSGAAIALMVLVKEVILGACSHLTGYYYIGLMGAK